MRTIVQVAPEIGPGTGVGAVAFHLEREWTRQGHRVLRYTLRDSGAAFIPGARGGVSGRLALLARVVWFSTLGTARARRFLQGHPGAVSICHNDALLGDVYVNHGLVQAAMRSRGHYALRTASGHRQPVGRGRPPVAYSQPPARARDDRDHQRRGHGLVRSRHALRT